MTHYVMPGYFYAVAGLAMFYFAYNLQKLFSVSIGKSEDHRKLTIIKQIVNIFIYGVAQFKVNSKRFTLATIMHILLGWGGLVLVFATTVDMFVKWGILVKYFPDIDTPWFAFINDTAGFLFIIGLLIALYRRFFDKPEKLPHSDFLNKRYFLADTGILILLILISVTGFLSEAVRIGELNTHNAQYSWFGNLLSSMFSPTSLLLPTFWWIHAIISLLMIAILPMTKMFHVITVIANVGLTDIENRGKIRPMNVSELMEDPDADFENMALGVNKIEDFTWKQLLDTISCTECSRCVQVCPANLTGKPLSPMELITGIRDTLLDNPKEELIGNIVSETQLWSCTTCGACMEVCPALIEHIPTFTDLRRYLVLSEGKPHEQASDSLEKTLQSGNPWGFPKRDRTKWATDAELEVPVFSKKKKADVLWWVGCAGSYDPRNQEIAKAMVKIFETANIDYAILGTEESCTGDSARRMGEEYLFETLAIQNIDLLSKYDFKTIVTTCPHCFHTFAKEYPNFGGNYTVIHHSEFIDKLIKDGKLSPSASLEGKVTYHDACYLGRHNDIYDSPRDILKNSLSNNAEMVEMPQNKNESFCCGAGGGNMWYEINEGDRINVTRFEEAENTGADTIATACSFCMIMMDDAMKVKGKDETMKIVDIAEVVADGL
jgi:Fe-S oxidoreductase/nitrate reductase gamma subunit